MTSRDELLDVFCAGLSLPLPNDSVLYPEHSASNQIEKHDRVKSLSSFLGEDDFYWELSIDPRARPSEIDVADSKSIGSGSLADDLYDIYWDLYDGLSVLDAIDAETAVVVWATDFRVHWGSHVADSLSRIHRIINYRLS